MLESKSTKEWKFKIHALFPNIASLMIQRFPKVFEGSRIVPNINIVSRYQISAYLQFFIHVKMHKLEIRYREMISMLGEILEPLATVGNLWKLSHRRRDIQIYSANFKFRRGCVFEFEHFWHQIRILESVPSLLQIYIPTPNLA